MSLKTGLRNVMGLTGVLAFVLMTAAPSGFASSSKDAKEKVEAAEKALASLDETPALSLVFYAGEYDPLAINRALKETPG